MIIGKLLLRLIVGFPNHWNLIQFITRTRDHTGKMPIASGGSNHWHIIQGDHTCSWAYLKYAYNFWRVQTLASKLMWPHMQMTIVKIFPHSLTSPSVGISFRVTTHAADHTGKIPCWRIDVVHRRWCMCFNVMQSKKTFQNNWYSPRLILQLKYLGNVEWQK